MLKTLQEMGFPKAYPLSVRVKIVNPTRPDTGIMLGKGTDPTPGKWPGHLVIIVPNHDGDDHLLIDLTVVQVNGKVCGIDLDPVLGIVDDGFVKGKRPTGWPANGCELVYEAFPEDDSFVRETDWSRVQGLDRAVKMVTDRLGYRAQHVAVPSPVSNQRPPS
ncbi:MAG: hypothetical protein NTY19_43880 [Planctomycetota bacterium]|nr:hypothetical protein [Planctomycetota bacterium]